MTSEFHLISKRPARLSDVRACTRRNRGGTLWLNPRLFDNAIGSDVGRDVLAPHPSTSNRCHGLIPRRGAAAMHCPRRMDPTGEYLRTYMTHTAQGVRLLGMGVMSFGAWEHRWWLVVIGALLILAAWARGLARGRHSVIRRARDYRCLPIDRGRASKR